MARTKRLPWLQSSLQINVQCSCLHLKSLYLNSYYLNTTLQPASLITNLMQNHPSFPLSPLFVSRYFTVSPLKNLLWKFASSSLVETWLKIEASGIEGECKFSSLVLLSRFSENPHQKNRMEPACTQVRPSKCSSSHCSYKNMVSYTVS